MRTLRATLSIIMVLTMVLCAFSGISAYAQEDTASQYVMGRIHIDNVPITPFSEMETEHGTTTPRKANSVTYPSSYSSVEEGYVTEVKDQNPYGTCWAHGAAAAAESSLIKNNGYPITTNLSELHLAYYMYNYAYDELGMLSGDGTTIGSQYKRDGFLDLGGTNLCTPFTYARWTGVTDEVENPEFSYSNATKSFSVSDTSKAYRLDAAHLEDAYWVSSGDKDDLKYMIMEYGAGTIAYYHSDSYLNYSTSAYYYGGSSYANHEVTVVGWDDNYSRSNFSSRSRPSSNGAWLVKNSWASDWGDDGYFWLSYEDKAFLKEYASFYAFGSADNYDNNYQYDGSSRYDFAETDNGSYQANVFTANSNEELKAVSFWTAQNDVDYSIMIYTNVSGKSSPESGTKALSAEIKGNEPYAGYHTIELPSSIYLNAGTKFSVVVKMSCNTENSLALFEDKSDSSWTWMIFTNKTEAGQSFFKSASSSSWVDKSSSGVNYRIKAFTDSTTSAPVVTTDTEPDTNSETPIVSDSAYERITDVSVLADGDKLVLVDSANSLVALSMYASGAEGVIAAAPYESLSDLTSDALWTVSLKYDSIYLENEYGLQLSALSANKAYLDTYGSALTFNAVDGDMFTLSANTWYDTRYFAFNSLADGFRFYRENGNASKFELYRYNENAARNNMMYVNGEDVYSVDMKQGAVVEDSLFSLVRDTSELKNGDQIVLFNDVYSQVLLPEMALTHKSTLNALELDSPDFANTELWTVVIEDGEMYLASSDGNRITASNMNAVNLSAEGTPVTFVNGSQDNTFRVEANSKYLRFNPDISGYRFYTSGDFSSNFSVYKLSEIRRRTTITCGDLNDDTLVNMVDVVLSQRMIAGLLESTVSLKAAADLNTDGEVSMLDVVSMQKHIAGFDENTHAGARTTLVYTK